MLMVVALVMVLMMVMTDVDFLIYTFNVSNIYKSSTDTGGSGPSCGLGLHSLILLCRL